ncbi:MAG: FG-GAP-like repeat-containing protein [Bacteroidales bacterium]
MILFPRPKNQFTVAFILLAILIFFGLTTANSQVMWSYDIQDMAFGQSAVADIDDDGKPEIVFSTYMKDGNVYALNGEDGSLLWKYPVGDCCDAAPIIFDVDLDGLLEVIVGSSCIAKTYCFHGSTGGLKWQTPTGGTDSPPTIGDVDNDGKPEILHGQFNGSVICINGEDGSISWTQMLDANASVQTCPTLLDVDNNGQLDFVVATWSYADNNKIYAFRGDDHSLIWESEVPDDLIYHGASFGDIDNDGFMELAIGSYDDHVYLLNAENGSLKWSHYMGNYCYVGGPTQMADLNNDGLYEILAAGWYKVKALDTAGQQLWAYNFPDYNSSFRGAAIADIDHDGILDALYGTNDGIVYGLRGTDGQQIFSLDLAAAYGDTFDIDHAPVIADLDGDGFLEAFVAGGKTYYPQTELDYGRAYAFRLPGGRGMGWPMFQRDIVRSSRVPLDWANSAPQLTNNNQIRVLAAPNPFTDNLLINICLQFPGLARIACANPLGELVLPVIEENISEKVIDLNFPPHASPGVYILTVTTAESVITTRLIKR